MTPHQNDRLSSIVLYLVLVFTGVGVTMTFAVPRLSANWAMTGKLLTPVERLLITVTHAVQRGFGLVLVAVCLSIVWRIVARKRLRDLGNQRGFEIVDKRDGMIS